jgi:hypothetical protein
MSAFPTNPTWTILPLNSGLKTLLHATRSDHRGVGFRFPVEATDYTLFHNVQTESRGHPGSISRGLKRQEREADLSTPTSPALRTTATSHEHIHRANVTRLLTTAWCIYTYSICDTWWWSMMAEACEGVFISNSTELSTSPYPQPDQIQHIPAHLICQRSILILSTHLRLGLRSGLFHSRFTQISYPHSYSFSPPIHAAWPTHLILLALIILIILGEEYKSQSSSLCNFWQTPVN